MVECDKNGIGEVIDVHATCDQLDKEKRYIYLLCLLFYHILFISSQLWGVIPSLLKASQMKNNTVVVPFSSFSFEYFLFVVSCFCLFDFTSSLDSVFLNFPFNLFLWNSIAEVWKGYNHSCRNGQIAEFVAISVLCYFSATLWLLKLMDSLWKSLGILIYQCTCNVVNTAIMIKKVVALVYKFVIGCFEIRL